MTGAGSIANCLAAGGASINLENVPPSVIAIAKRCIVDISGVMLAGTSARSAKTVQALAKSIYGSGPCRVVGTKDQLTPHGAALANGTAAHALDFDDNSYAGVVHGSATVFPAVLATAQNRGASGAELLQGFIAGLEVEFALGKALTDSFYDKGWWTTAVLGTIGAAAGAARVAGFDTDTTAQTLALAAIGAGGLRAVRGTEAKHYYCGRAAESGVMAASLAARGITAPTDAFEDKFGFLSVLNDSIFDAAAIENFGQDFGLENPGIDIKRFPVCYSSHAAAEATQEIVTTQNLSPPDIKTIICHVPPIVASNLTFPNPATANEAQFSLHFAVAIITLFGDIELSDLNSDTISRKDVQSMLGKIEMKVREKPGEGIISGHICPEWACVTIVTTTGETFQAAVGTPTGSAAKPMSETALQSKFLACASKIEIPNNMSDLLEQLLSIDKVTDSRLLF